MAGDKSQAAAHILYAEDDLPSGRLIKSIAEGQGYTINVVTTGADFLKALTVEKPDAAAGNLEIIGKKPYGGNDPTNLEG